MKQIDYFTHDIRIGRRTLNPDGLQKLLLEVKRRGIILPLQAGEENDELAAIHTAMCKEFADAEATAIEAAAHTKPELTLAEMQDAVSQAFAPLEAGYQLRIASGQTSRSSEVMRIVLRQITQRTGIELSLIYEAAAVATFDDPLIKKQFADASEEVNKELRIQMAFEQARRKTPEVACAETLLLQRASCAKRNETYPQPLPQWDEAVDKGNANALKTLVEHALRSQGVKSGAALDQKVRRQMHQILKDVVANQSYDPDLLKDRPKG